MRRVECRTWLDTLYFPGDLRWFYCPLLRLSARFYGTLFDTGRWENYIEFSDGSVLVEVID